MADGESVPPLGMTIEEFRTHGKALIDYIADYYSGIESHRVNPTVEPGYLAKLLPAGPPAHAEPWADIMADVDKFILPGVTHWQSPRFHAFFPSQNSFPAMLGDMLSNCFNMIGLSWAAAPALTELEEVVMDWTASLLGLPDVFRTVTNGGGVIQGSASESALVAVLVARETTLERHPGKTAGDCCAYVTSTRHACLDKAVKLAGMRRLCVVEDPAALRLAIERDIDEGFVPCFLGCTLGSTSTVAFDDLTAFIPIAKQAGIFTHVDAAYAGAACVCPEYRFMLEGVDQADSFCFNAHKFLLTNFDCSALFIADRRALQRSLSSSMEIFKNSTDKDETVTNFRDWQVPLGRRFRALKLWFVIRTFGIEGLQRNIRRHCELAEQFEALVREDDRFRIFCPRMLGLVCFTVHAGDTAAANSATLELLSRIGKDGDIMMTQSAVGGVNFIRFCVCSPMTTPSHVEAAWKSIQRAADAVI